MIKVGGNSYNNGIQFTGEKYSVSFKDEHGKTAITVSKNIVNGTNSFMRLLKKIPIIRGFINVICKNKFLFAIIAIDLITNIITLGIKSYKNSMSSELTTLITILSFAIVILSVTIIMCLILKIFGKMKSTWMYHGAEHKVIETNYAGKDINFENCKAAPRVSDNCGTMLVSLMLFVYVILFILQLVLKVRFWSSINLILTITVAYELFLVKRNNIILKPAFKFGRLLQERCFTKEPNDHQLAQAILAFSILEGLETGKYTIEDVNEALAEKFMLNESKESK